LWLVGAIQITISSFSIVLDGYKVLHNSLTSYAIQITILKQ
jgi:hypothetical protein